MTLPVDLTPDASNANTGELLLITLYIAGSSLNSLRALTNLKAICQAYFPDRHQIEIVDIFDDPLRALADKVLVTPTLVKTAPAPLIRIIGDLRDTEMVVLALQSVNRKP